MSMLLVAKKEFIRSLKNKKKIFLMMIVPLLSIVCALAINDFMKPSISIGIINDGNDISGFIEKIENVDGVKLNSANEETLNTDMILAKYAAVIKFENNKEFQVNCLDSNMKIIIEDAINEVVINGETTKINTIIKTIEENSINYAERGAAFIFLTLMISSIVSACNILNDNKEGIITRYKVSPNSIISYITGDYIYNLASTSIQAIVSIGIVYVLNINIGISFISFIIIGILISIIVTSLSILVVSISNSELQASLLASSIALITSLLGGAFLPLDKMPDTIKIISNFSMTKWIMELARNMESGINNNSLSIIICLTGISILFIIIGINISKKRFA